MTEGVSIIIPTYREYENIPIIAAAIFTELTQHNISHEIIFVDDYSGDGTASLCNMLAAHYPLRLIQRKDKNRSLSLAVLEGIKCTSRELVVVMDADMSHPPSQIPIMLNKIMNHEVDFIIGSRYVQGSSIDRAWPLYRRANSYVATLLSIMFFRFMLNVPILKEISDPCSGFFAFRRNSLRNVDKLSPIGYKIGLELLVKGNFTAVGEVPIHFSDRRFGSSKLGLGQQLLYLFHLSSLFFYKNLGGALLVCLSIVGIPIMLFFLLSYRAG